MIQETPLPNIVKTEFVELLPSEMSLIWPSKHYYFDIKSLKQDIILSYELLNAPDFEGAWIITRGCTQFYTTSPKLDFVPLILSLLREEWLSTTFLEIKCRAACPVSIRLQLGTFETKLDHSSEIMQPHTTHKITSAKPVNGVVVIDHHNLYFFYNYATSVEVLNPEVKGIQLFAEEKDIIQPIETYRSKSGYIIPINYGSSKLFIHADTQVDYKVTFNYRIIYTQGVYYRA